MSITDGVSLTAPSLGSSPTIKPRGRITAWSVGPLSSGGWNMGPSARLQVVQALPRPRVSINSCFIQRDDIAMVTTAAPREKKNPDGSFLCSFTARSLNLTQDQVSRTSPSILSRTSIYSANANTSGFGIGRNAACWLVSSLHLAMALLMFRLAILLRSPEGRVHRSV